MLRIRLRRVGKKKQPMYRIVVADSRAPRDGAFVEAIGIYHPLENPSKIEIDAEKAKMWISKGAQPSDRVAKLLAIQNIMELPPKLKARIELIASRPKPAKEEPAAAAPSPAAAAAPAAAPAPTPAPTPPPAPTATVEEAPPAEEPSATEAPAAEEPSATEAPAAEEPAAEEAPTAAEAAAEEPPAAEATEEPPAQ